MGKLIDNLNELSLCNDSLKNPNQSIEEKSRSFQTTRTASVQLQDIICKLTTKGEALVAANARKTATHPSKQATNFAELIAEVEKAQTHNTALSDALGKILRILKSMQEH